MRDASDAGGIFFVVYLCLGTLSVKCIVVIKIFWCVLYNELCPTEHLCFEFATTKTLAGLVLLRLSPDQIRLMNGNLKSRHLIATLGVVADSVSKDWFFLLNSRSFQTPHSNQMKFACEFHIPFALFNANGICKACCRFNS